jgi:hypothetical protein
MTKAGKVKLTHTHRAAFVYIRQSSPQQVENNRESAARQHALVEKACELRWAENRPPWSMKTLACPAPER